MNAQDPIKKPPANRQSITAKLAAEKASKKVDSASQLEMLPIGVGLIGLLFIVMAIFGRAASCHFGYSMASDDDLLRLMGPIGGYWDEGVSWLVGSGGLRNPGGFYYLLLAIAHKFVPTACGLYAYQLILAAFAALLLFAQLRAFYGPLAALAGLAGFVGSSAFLGLSLDFLWLGFLPMFVVAALLLMMKGASANTPQEIKWIAALIGLAMMIDPGAWVMLVPFLLLPIFVPGWRSPRAWSAAFGMIVLVYFPFIIGLFIPGSHSFSLFGAGKWAVRLADLSLRFDPAVIGNGIVMLLPGLKPAVLTGQSWFWIVMILTLPALIAAATGLGLTLLGFRRHRKAAKIESDTSVTGFDPVLAVAGLAIASGLLFPALRLGPTARMPLIEPGWLMATIALAVLIAGSIGHLFSPQRMKAPLRVGAIIVLMLGLLLPATQLAAPRAIAAQQIGADYARVEGAIALMVTGQTDAERQASASRAMSSLSIAVQNHWTCFDRPIGDWCVEPIFGWTAPNPDRTVTGYVTSPCAVLFMDTASARLKPKYDFQGLSAILGQSASPLQAPVAIGADSLLYYSTAQGGCPTALDNRSRARGNMVIDQSTLAKLTANQAPIAISPEQPYDFVFSLKGAGLCWSGADDRATSGKACPITTARVKIGYNQQRQIQISFDSRELHGSDWRLSNGPIAAIRAPALRFTQVLGSRSFDVPLTDGYLGYRGAALPIQILDDSIQNGSYKLQLVGFRVENLRPGQSGPLPNGKPFVIDISPNISMVPAN